MQEGSQGLMPRRCTPLLPADILQEILLKEQELLQPGILGDDEDEDGEEEEKLYMQLQRSSQVV